MSHETSTTSKSTVWTGKPWIVPGVVGRTILMVVVSLVIVWLEFLFGVDSIGLLNVPSLWWTALLLFLVWLVSLTHLLLLRASNFYALRNDSLEIRTGIFTSRSYVITPSGFADLEVVRSVSARILNTGDIIIRGQSETGGDRRMVRVREPLRTADQIRQVMARPIVRVEGFEPTAEKKQ